MKPRIYLYRITFEGRPEWYWGIHKEKKFDEHYMGSPCTHKEFWKLHTPVKEILEIFEYSEEGWKTANIHEQKLISPYLNDPLCLNEACGQVTSLATRAKVGKEVMLNNWRKNEFRSKRINHIKSKWEDPLYRDKMISILKSSRKTALQKNLPSEKVTQERFKKVLISGINLNKEGWVTKVANLWNVSHTQVRRIFDKYWKGPEPWKRKSITRSCSLAA